MKSTIIPGSIGLAAIATGILSTLLAISFYTGDPFVDLMLCFISGQ
ncbi:MAG: hypothetical protein KKB70_08525 [Proteobacteria bacterium]|nr:hypothetical protein [Pseudomonadota bacterium]